jgi:hypothetical protein
MQKEVVQLEAKDIKIWEVIVYFWKKAMKYKWLFILCIILRIIALLCDIYEPVYTSRLLDLIQASV